LNGALVGVVALLAIILVVDAAATWLKILKRYDGREGAR
jgi:hypothetical protein